MNRCWSSPLSWNAVKFYKVMGHEMQLLSQESLTLLNYKDIFIGIIPLMLVKDMLIRAELIGDGLYFFWTSLLNVKWLFVGIFGGVWGDSNGSSCGNTCTAFLACWCRCVSRWVTLSTVAPLWSTVLWKGCFPTCLIWILPLSCTGGTVSPFASFQFTLVPGVLLAVWKAKKLNYFYQSYLNLFCGL